MRQPRNFAADRCYHLVSRIANRAFYLSEEERTRFVERMWRVAYFSCVDVLAYCVMDNHFHILAYVPPQRELSEEEVLARVRTLYLGDRLVVFEKDWALQLAHDDPEKRRQFLARYIARMWSASEFMKTLKQLTSQSFNSRRDHVGTMWESRFHARMMMPDEKPVLMRVAGYIDRNPVKAGLVKWPDEYRWCGFAAACAGDVRCIDGYRFIYTFAPVDWARARELHEMSIGLALKELDEDPEARAASGSNGGGRLSVTADRLESIRTLRRERMEIGLAKAAPDAMPRILERGSRRVRTTFLRFSPKGQGGRSRFATCSDFPVRTTSRRSTLRRCARRATLHRLARRIRIRLGWSTRSRRRGVGRSRMGRLLHHSPLHQKGQTLCSPAARCWKANHERFEALSKLKVEPGYKNVCTFKTALYGFAKKYPAADHFVWQA